MGNSVEYVPIELTEDYLYKVEGTKYFIKEVIIKSQELDSEFTANEEMVLVTLKNKKDSTLKHLEIIKVMNLILKTIDVMEEEVEFVDKYKECIYNLQRITDYIYFKEILSISYDSQYQIVY